MTHSPDDTHRSRRGIEDVAATDWATTESAAGDRAAKDRATTATAARETTVLLSCRGTWLVHQDGTGECTEAGCSVPAEAHELVVQCSAVLTACGCTQF